MGHLIFAGLFCFFLILIFSRLFFGYLSAKKNKPNNKERASEIPVEGMYFKPKKRVGFFFLSLIPILLVLAVFGCFKLSQKNDPDATVVFWLIADSIIPVVAVFSLAAFEAFRSYLFVNKEGFRYHDVFSDKKYSNENIEGVYRDSEFVFIKCKNKRIPIIIEKTFGNPDIIYETLCALKSSQDK